MEEFTKTLNNIPGSYYAFTAAVLSYVKKNRARYEKVDNFIRNNPDAFTSEILSFISDQEDFYEDASYPCTDAI